MARKSTLWVFVVVLACLAAIVPTQVFAQTSCEETGEDYSSPKTCYWSSFAFGADSWITSAPTDSIVAEFSWHGVTYPAFVATHYGNGKAVFAPGSAFSEINNITNPHNVRHELFLNSVRWATGGKLPSQTTLLITFGHSELLTYHRGGEVCCGSNIVRALGDAGYTVVVTPDVPSSLLGYDAVIMPGVGWAYTPAYPDPQFWCEDSCHAFTAREISVLLDFVEDGGGLVASAEYGNGANWMNPIGTPMNVTFDFIDSSVQEGHRVVDHPIFLRDCRISLPLMFRDR